MSGRAGDYGKRDLIESLHRVGVELGDTVLVQASLGLLGRAQDCASIEDTCQLLLGALHEVIGAEGTILVPTYSYSFCRGEVFDAERTPAAIGPFPEFFRLQPGVIRSRDPIFSVAGLGPRAEGYLTGLPNTCFGEDCVYARVVRENARVLTIGLPLNWVTLRHHAEEMAGVPFRFKKLFTGWVRDDDGRFRKDAWVYNVRILAGNGYPDGRRLEAKALAMGLCHSASLGRGEIFSVEARSYYDLILRELERDPWFTARGPAGDPASLEEARVAARKIEVHLPRDATMVEMVGALWRLPRDIVSDGYDAALSALSKQVPMTVHQYPTGTSCWTWIVPEKWTCHEAFLETIDGKRLFSYADNPLHVVSYSLPFEGEITREELLRHLHVHPKMDGAVPFHFQYYERNWGLCCSKKLRDGLADDRYRVVVRTDFSFGMLKVGEVVARGKTDEAIVLCAHLCHPAMANDDLAGVVVGVEVMRRLLRRRDLRYTYHFLIVPETIGSVAYLSHNEDLIPKMKGGLSLEMLGLDNAHALQLSFAANTELDRLWRRVLLEHDPGGWTTRFRTVTGNDERQFNAPGVRVPMLSLSRALPPSSPDSPYREYHSDHDTASLIVAKRLEESCDLVLRMIDALEDNRVPVNNFKGEVFCSRFGLNLDRFADPDAHRTQFDIMYRVDGTHSIEDIAEACGVSVETVKTVVDELEDRGLVTYTHSQSPAQVSFPAPTGNACQTAGHDAPTGSAHDRLAPIPITGARVAGQE